MLILRSTRNLLTYEINNEVKIIRTRSIFEPQLNVAKQPIKKKSTRVKRQPRKKSIKIQHGSYRRPKRARHASQIRTIDLIEEEIVLPEGFLMPKVEAGEKIKIYSNF